MKPDINVTPLIDILLVLLIIFMVISPLKPAKFEAKIPSERLNPEIPINPNPHTLIVSINQDKSLTLNNEELGEINQPIELTKKLTQIFAERFENGVFNESLADKKGLNSSDKVQKTVFIKAPKTLAYGEVVRVIDEIKLAGANPISLQIDDLQ